MILSGLNGFKVKCATLPCTGIGTGPTVNLSLLSHPKRILQIRKHLNLKFPSLKLLF